jgi:hypothetical protein
MDANNLNFNTIQDEEDADQALIKDAEQILSWNQDTEQIANSIKYQLSGIITANRNRLTGKSIESFSESSINQIKQSVFRALDELEYNLILASNPAIINGYSSGVSVSSQLLSAQLDTLEQIFPIDSKTLKSLIRSMNDDFNSAIADSKKMLTSFFRLSSQNLIREAQISTAILRGNLERNSLWGAKKELMKEFIDKLGDNKLLPITCTRKDGTTFIRNYKPSTYSELVTRTRYGQAQVLGAIEVSEANGVYTFTVTSHNTKTAICKPHEGRIYTTDPELIRLGIFPELNGFTTPLYHVNCQHRLVPKVYSMAALERLKSRKANLLGLEGALERELARKERKRLEANALEKAGISLNIQESYIGKDGLTGYRAVRNPEADRFLNEWRRENP